MLRVSAGNIRQDALDPDHRFASMPLHILNQDGRPGMTRRQCTGEYKVKPIKQKVRELLGYPYPTRIPKGVFVEQWVGISTDEFHRAKDADVKYMRNRHPLVPVARSSSQHRQDEPTCATDWPAASSSTSPTRVKHCQDRGNFTQHEDPRSTVTKSPLPVKSLEEAHGPDSCARPP